MSVAGEQYYQLEAYCAGSWEPVEGCTYEFIGAPVDFQHFLYRVNPTDGQRLQRTGPRECRWRYTPDRGLHSVG